MIDKNQKILFHEVQKFTDSKMLVYVLGILAFVLISMFVVFNIINNDFSLLMIIILLFLMPFALLATIKLETKISENEISIRFHPFHFSFLVFSFENIQTIVIRKYSPLIEYGGYGIRYKFFKRDKAYNISGNIGIQLLMKDGSKILIGTQKQNELEFLVTKFLNNKSTENSSNQQIS